MVYCTCFFLFATALIPSFDACTTVLVHHATSTSGAFLIAHSNDGDGDVPGALSVVPRRNGSHAFYTKPGGYASMNEYGLTLAESTCSGIKFNRSGTGGTNIVELSNLCLSTTKTARACVKVMGNAAASKGYSDEAESLLVADAMGEGWIFHVLADDTGKSAIWVAEPLEERGVAVVSNAFTIREVKTHFLRSENLFSVAGGFQGK